MFVRASSYSALRGSSFVVSFPNRRFKIATLSCELLFNAFNWETKLLKHTLILASDFPQSSGLISDCALTLPLIAAIKIAMRQKRRELSGFMRTSRGRKYDKTGRMLALLR